jgi:hypothetical protein
VLCLQLKKLQEKLRKCQTEVEATREKYQACLNDLNSYNAKYIEDMTEVKHTFFFTILLPIASHAI